MSDCYGYQHNFDQPQSAVFQPEYPPPLRPSGVSHTAGLDVWICDQALVGDEVVDHLEFGYFYTTIANPDSTQPRNAYTLLLTVYSNSPAFIARSRSHGLDVTLAPAFGPVSLTPISEDADLTSFVYPSDSKDFTFRGEVDHHGGGVAPWTQSLHYVSGGKLHRISYAEKFRLTSANPGAMEFGPNSYWARHARANHVDDLVNYQTNGTIAFDFDNVWTMNLTVSR